MSIRIYVEGMQDLVLFQLLLDERAGVILADATEGQHFLGVGAVWARTQVHLRGSRGVYAAASETRGNILRPVLITILHLSHF